jgi:hypothetical protein
MELQVRRIVCVKKRISKRGKCMSCQWKKFAGEKVNEMSKKG